MRVSFVRLIRYCKLEVSVVVCAFVEPIECELEVLFVRLIELSGLEVFYKSLGSRSFHKPQTSRIYFQGVITNYSLPNL